VNFVASILMNGARTSCASRRAISVLPRRWADEDDVLGRDVLAEFVGKLLRRQRLRMARHGLFAASAR